MLTCDTSRAYFGLSSNKIAPSRHLVDAGSEPLGGVGARDDVGHAEGRARGSRREAQVHMEEAQQVLEALPPLLLAILQRPHVLVQAVAFAQVAVTVGNVRALLDPVGRPAVAFRNCRGDGDRAGKGELTSNRWARRR